MTPAPGMKKLQYPGPLPSSAKSPLTIFRKLFNCGMNNEFEAMAETIDNDCEWVFMSNMQRFKGKKDVIALCKAGRFASEKTPEIILDVATPEWGVFEYVNRGIITENLSALAASSGWQFPVDPSTLVGRKYAVPVCFVYHTTPRGKIYLLHEYLDLASLTSQFE